MRSNSCNNLAIFLISFSLVACSGEVQEQPVYNNSSGYYYHQPGYAPQPVPYYQPQPQPYVEPGSRYYSNPYAIPPSQYYNYYDHDYYYAAPNYYGTSESYHQELLEKQKEKAASVTDDKQ